MKRGGIPDQFRNYEFKKASLVVGIRPLEVMYGSKT